MKALYKHIQLLPCCAIAMWIFFIFTPCLSFAANSSIDVGVMLYQKGQYNEALMEFQRILTANPKNREARKYLQLVKASKDLLEERKNLTKQNPRKIKSLKTAKAQMTNELNALEKEYLKKRHQDLVYATETEKSEEIIIPIEEIQIKRVSKPISPFGTFYESEKIYDDAVIEDSDKTTEIHGEIRLGIGYDVSNNDLIWKRANFDLNEKNWRLISWNQLNNRSNTYDPAIFDSLSFDIDVEPKESNFSYHANLTIDPWSFIGKSDKITLVSTSGGPSGVYDLMDVQLLYWSNTGYSVNQLVDTLRKGDLAAINEYKIHNGYIPATTITSKGGQTFNLPQTNIHKWFFPVREFWVNYEPSDNLKVQVFPYALEDKALSSDDPLALSNNHIWWEESPWLANWKPGHLNTDTTDQWGWPTTPDDFTKGYWDDALAFQVRDSEGKRLTALRGFSIDLAEDNTEMQFVLASPKTLWQDYDTFDALPGSFRLKHFLSDNFYMGMTDNIHLGFVDAGKVDAYNTVSANDIGLLINPGLLVKAEHAFSYSVQDRSNDDYDTKSRGNAYDLSIFGTTNNIESPDIDYFAIQPDENEYFFKTRLRMTRMDKGFESSLANYHETRDDQFWSRHITFREPMDFTDIKYCDIEPFRIGNSIDYGRYVIDWRTDSSFWNGRLTGLTDIRNAHATSSNKYIETVARTEWSYQATDKLETRLLLVGHHLPKTTGGVDPYITTGEGEFITNTNIEDGLDPSGYTTSIGLKYDFSKYLSWNGAWEYTNDFGAGIDNFPRHILTDASMTTFQNYGMTYREVYSFLYGQNHFPSPPYQYVNIFRTGFDITPNDQWNIYVDFTRNPYEYAGPIGDNMNHLGLAVSYFPTEKLGLFTKYTWSRIKNINDAVFNVDNIEMENHHNIFFETQYLFDEDNKLSFSYGVGPSIYSAYASSTPFLGSTTPTIDTQNIFRLFYTKKF